MKKLLRYEFISIFSIVLLLLIYFINIHYEHISNLENFKTIILSYGVFAPIIFVLIFILLALIGFPVSVLYFITGFLFGLVYGYFLSIFSALFSAVIAFSISRYIFKKYLNKPQTINSFSYTSKLISNIREKSKNQGFYTILILRLYFVPFIGLSYASGLVNELKFRDFTLATFIVNFFESFVFIFLGVAFLENIYLFFMALTLVIIFISIPRFFKKHHLNIHFKKH